MTNKRYDWCKQCNNCHFDLKKGILCGLTKRKPDFVDTCPDFEQVLDSKELKRRGISEGYGVGYQSRSNQLTKYQLRFLVLMGLILSFSSARLWVWFSLDGGNLKQWLAIPLVVFIAALLGLMGGRGKWRILVLSGIFAVLVLVLGNLLFILFTTAEVYQISLFDSLRYLKKDNILFYYQSTFDWSNALIYLFALVAAVIVCRFTARLRLGAN